MEAFGEARFEGAFKELEKAFFGSMTRAEGVSTTLSPSRVPNRYRGVPHRDCLETVNRTTTHLRLQKTCDRFGLLRFSYLAIIV